MNIFPKYCKFFLKSFISFITHLFKFIIKVYDKFLKDAGFARAGSLAFNTLLAAIPFIALEISLLNAFGTLAILENQVMDFVLNLLIPTKQGQAADLIKTFLNNSNKLGVIGLVFFALSSIMLLNTVSVNLNAVWGSEIKNNFIKKFTTYTSVIFFGTLFLAASTTITTRFNFLRIEEIPIINLILVKASPYFFNFLVILLIIGIVPSGKIRSKYLFFVSAMGAFFWEFLKFAFFNVSSTFIRMSIIYGTIAIIPIFLFWIYVIWIIIIVALEIAWLMQYKNQNKFYNLHDQIGKKVAFNFSLFMAIAQDFYSGNKLSTSEFLSRKFSVNINTINETLCFLEDCDFITRSGEKGLVWVPSKSLSKITTHEILNTIIGITEEIDFCSEADTILLKKFAKVGFSGIENISIVDYIKKQEHIK